MYYYKIDLPNSIKSTAYPHIQAATCSLESNDMMHIILKCTKVHNEYF